jgi:cell division protein FtsQ
MDGGGRFLQPLGTIGLRFGLAKPAASPLPAGKAGVRAEAGTDAKRVAPSAKAKRSRARSQRARSAPISRWERIFERMTRRGAGIAMACGLVLATGVYGGVRGGGLERFFDEYGSVQEIVARGLGFNIAAITITGSRQLLSTEVLALAGIHSKDSLIFLDVQDVRKKLISSPVIMTASVRKLYPNQLVIAIEERKADAVWQQDGEVSIIAADGRVIDKMRDQRYARLPFVVGTGANLRYREYMTILAAAGHLRSKVRAGTLIAGRRWTIKFANGLDLKLPEVRPDRAMQRFAVLDKKFDLLERDLLVADMRTPGRFIGQLSAEASARRDAPAKKQQKRKGGAA